MAAFTAIWTCLTRPSWKSFDFCACSEMRTKRWVPPRSVQSTDSAPFQDYCPAICLRENERRDHIGSGWDRNWYQPTDVFITYTDADFRLGLNAAQTTLAAVAQLAGAKIE